MSKCTKENCEFKAGHESEHPCGTVVEGATGAREWLEKRKLPNGIVHYLKDDGSSNQNFGERLDFLLEAYASSQLKKLDGVAQQAAEEIWSDLEKQSYPQVKALDSHIVAYIKHSWAAIISKLIAERLSK